MINEIGPQLPISEKTHAEKYRSKGETFRDACGRIANALKDDQPHYKTFRDILIYQRFMPAGRIQAAMGSSKVVTPYNCFVSGTISDSFVEGPGSIMDRAKEAAATMRQGGGIGYDFSTLRPRGALIRKLASQSGGPIEFMKIYDAVCKCVASSGHRRGAQMGVMRIDHPDIQEFINAKHDMTTLTGFNISVAVTDKFMDCLEKGMPFPLTFNGETVRETDPELLWDNLMRSTWDWGEPGVLFIDTINRMNNLYYCEEIAATNPCGEQPLPPHGACLLGSFNLVRYLVQKPKDEQWRDTGFYFDYARLREDIPHVVRAMDNVVDRADYPLVAQGREARAKRRMGLGVAGLANTLEAMGHPYGSPDFLVAQAKIMETLLHGTYEASVQLAVEKGSFAKFDADKYVAGEFVKTLPGDLVGDIKKFGIRNSHLTSIAPTGTISLTADNVSSGIEPVFALESERTIIDEEGPKTWDVSDFGYRVLGVSGKTTDEVTVDEHINVLLTASKYVDSAVSKTCNVPGTVEWEAFKDVYSRAYYGGAKGCTTFRTDGKRAGMMKAKSAPVEEDAASCRIDPATGRRECE